MKKTILAMMMGVSLAGADVWTERFEIEHIAPPPGVDPQIGGLATLPDQRVIACFHRGEVMIYDPAKRAWSLFAEGLHEPLGILVEDERNVLVMQRPELTRLTDTDGDGVADEYATVFDGFGMTGNYHEFAFGPARDAEGNFYVSLNVASNGAGIRKEIRGEWKEIGVPREHMRGEKWGENKEKAGRMYSRTPYRGWVLKISPDGKKMTPFACGFRSPDGIGFDAKGRLLVTDNQGDWLGTSKLHHVREGGFHGHPASLVWREGWQRNPLDVPVAELEKLRFPAAALLPQGELANSPTQPVVVPEKGFGAFAEETLVGDMNQTKLFRFVMDEGIEGASQGAAISFFDSESLGRGNHRMTFTDDGSLWLGKTHLSWAGAEGLLRLRVKDEKALAFTVKKMEAREGGFVLRLSEAADPESLQGLSLQSYRYTYHAQYGSPQMNREKHQPGLEWSEDGRELRVKLPKWRQGYVYALNLKGLKSEAGQPLLGDQMYYHLIKKP
ncbi:MAG: DUF7133 domain-containing protein [Verrucomicrobiales bacterium]